MSIADRFMAAFKGSDLAHGQTTIGNKRRNGKTEAKSFIVKQPLTKELIEEHLRPLLTKQGHKKEISFFVNYLIWIHH